MFIGQMNSMMAPHSGYMHGHSPYSMPPYSTPTYGNFLCSQATPPSFVSATTTSCGTSDSAFTPTTNSYPLLQNTFQADNIDDRN